MEKETASSNHVRDELPEFHFSGYVLDIGGRKLLDPDGVSQVVSSRAFDTLHFLLQHSGETLSKSDIMQAVWGRSVVEDNNLNQAIFSLRKIFGDSRNNNHFIKTIPGRGYCFIAPVNVTWVKPMTAKSASRIAVSGFHAPTWIRKSLPSLVLMLLFVAMLLGIYMTEKVGPGDSPGLGSESRVMVPESLSPEAAVARDGSDQERIRNSVAVLPFNFLDQGGDNALFALGLHDEINSQLSNIRSLKVIARNSILTLVEQDMSGEEIARLLRVENLLSGTILHTVENARISLQMHDAVTGISLWSQSYEIHQQDLNEMFAVQSSIAGDVARALETEIQEPELLSATPTQSFEAYRFNMAARMAHYQQDFAKEWELARQAIALDADYYDALATFASVNATLASFPLPGMDSQDHVAYALEAVNRMIELAPEKSRGYALKSIVLGTVRDWDGVSQMLETVRELNALLGDLNYIALVLMCLGDFDTAIDIYRANLVTEPLNLYGRGFLMAALELAGRHEEARTEYMLGEELNPDWWGDAVNVFMALGRDEPLEDISDIFGMSAELKSLLINIDKVEQVRNALERYRHTDNKISAEALYYAALAAKTGDQEAALELFQDALTDA